MANCSLKTGDYDYIFNPTPSKISISWDNSQGQMKMDIPSNRRPYLYNFLSEVCEITINTGILTSGYTTNTVLKDLDDIRYIMSGEASGEVADGMYHLEVPFTETHGATTRTYSKNIDSTLDNGMFGTSNDYIRFVVFPKSFRIDDIKPNITYVTLTFTAVQQVVSL